MSKPGADDGDDGEDPPPEDPLKDIEIVWLALETGYFDVPRGTSLAALANSFSISDVEASERLRRGIKHILEHSEFFQEKTKRRGGAPTVAD